MHLTLRAHQAAQRPAQAAFLRGTNPAAWLRELSRWRRPADQLTCYLVPESIRSVRVAGLFVIAREGMLPADVLEPYGSEADGRLFVPVHATLWPATAPQELATALLWPRQLLHPSIGLVGFDTTDALDLASLLDCGAPRPADWTRARPGLAPKPSLQQVRVLAPTVAEVVQDLQEDVGTVPLTELPGQAEAKTGLVQRLLDRGWHGLLTLLRSLVRWLPTWPTSRTLGLVGITLLVAAVGLLAWALIAQVSKGSLAPLVVPLLLLALRLWRNFTENANPHRPGANSTRPGLFQRLETWLGGRIKDLEQKRQGEIERLLRLFSENMDEALKYAIPLGGPYQDRGTAPESARLGRRSTDFNLGKLGGGGRVDAWNLDAYRHNLGLQYRAAATRETEAGRPKKAAYIYAHLLGDYQAAANALDAGGFPREAAALYKDHLHNLPAAAKCLEHGRLLLEAAELYAELREHEKAGDLHQRLDQPALAARHYERGVTLLLGNDDHPAAARLLADKLAAPARAQEVLLAGWDSSKQPEVCLRQYFDVLAAQPEMDLSIHVQAIFAGRTPRERRGPLLQVLAAVNEKHPAPALLAISREVAYDIVGTEAATGNTAHLPLLRHFLPGDRLIAADCSRFATSPARYPKSRATVSPSLAVRSLEATIKWKSAVSHRHQWVAVGLRDERLHLVRGDWYGNVEYYSWMTPLGATPAIMLVADDRHSARILLRTSGATSLESKQLPKNKYFPEALTIESPSWLPLWPTRVALLPDGTTAAARLRGSSITVERYTAEGKPLAPLIHYFANVIPDFDLAEGPRPSELLYEQGRYYSYCKNWLLSWPEDGGRSDREQVENHIYQLVRSPYAPALQLAAGVEEGVVLWEPTARGNNEPSSVSPFQADAHHELKFVGPHHLVTLGEHGAVLHYTGEEGYRQVRVIETESPPIAVLTTANRQQFALLESNGRITPHLIGE